MTFLVDANVLSEATRPEPDPRVLEWLARHEREIAVDPIILGELRARGLAMQIKDSLIAATALTHGLPVVTRNRRDFAPTGVEIVNPFD